MRMIVTAGPTREYIDPVRFITNASSGRMGYAVAAAAVAAGHEVTLLTGPVGLTPPAGCEVVPFSTVEELKAALLKRFGGCEALVMAAAVGDFRPEEKRETKIPRRGGPIEVRLVPTEDVLGAVTAGKRGGQTVVAFAVETGARDEMERKAQGEMKAKRADLVVLNGPEAMEAAESEACILSASGAVLGWGRRAKEELAREIVRFLEWSKKDGRSDKG